MRTDPAPTPIRTYTVGFLLSILLTIVPFAIVRYSSVSGWALTITLVGFAVLQLAVQLVFFLHIDREHGRRWNLIAFSFATLVVFIVVVGSLWIMHNLDYRMMPQDMDKAILQDEGIHH